MNGIFDMTTEQLDAYLADQAADDQAFHEAFAHACDEAFAEGKEEIECAPTQRSPG